MSVRSWRIGVIAELRRSGRVSAVLAERACHPLLEYLRGLGVAPLERPPVPVDGDRGDDRAVFVVSPPSVGV